MTLKGKLTKRKENRLVLITERGRTLDLCNLEIKESIQDNGKTLKLFVREKHNF